MNPSVHRNHLSNAVAGPSSLKMASAGIRHSSGNGTAFSAVAPSKAALRLPTARAPTKLAKALHPAQAFGHPSDVVSDPDLTLDEKRAILASWASDACAVDTAPALRPAS